MLWSYPGVSSLKETLEGFHSLFLLVEGHLMAHGLHGPIASLTCTCLDERKQTLT